MLWMSTQQRRRHIEYEDMFSLSKGDIRSIWGSDGRMRKVVGSHYFRALRGSNLGRGFTNAYEPSTELTAALRACLTDEANDRWIDVEGRAMRTLPRAIASKSGDGKRNTKWSGVSPANCIHIDVASLGVLRRNLEVATEPEGRPVFDEAMPLASDEAAAAIGFRQLAIDTIIKMSRNVVCPGALPIRYVEQSTGRLFAEGVSLQSAPREIRNAALAGCWDYDISNCHWSLIDQLATAHGHRCLAIQHYLGSKLKVRQEIAQGAGITIKQAKACLLMVMYGAPTSTYGSASIPQLIGSEAAKRLYATPAFESLHADVLKARATIVKGLKGGKGGWIRNELGLQISDRKPPKAILAHILQGLEAKALMTVVKEYGDKVLLCVHDGWVTREQLVVPDVEALIRAAIGLDVDIEEARLEPVMPLEATASLNPVDKTVSAPESEHLRGLPGISTLPSASSAPMGLCPSSPQAAPAASGGPGLFVSERPLWNRPPRLPALGTGSASDDARCHPAAARCEIALAVNTRCSSAKGVGMISEAADARGARDSS
jgi:hypothetical protein